MMSKLLGTVAAGVVLCAPAAMGADLEPGKPAPALEHVKWIKGEPIEEFQSGHVYVLDFWATWCGPCVASIPHLNELQAKYKDENVHVVGVAVWPKDQMIPTAKFVEAKGDKMAYQVVEDIDDKTAEAYMEAAGRNGIPTVFIVDKSGDVAWIGHPMAGLDEVLEMVVNDEFSQEALKKLQDEQAAEQAEADKLIDRMREAYMGNDWENVAKVADEMLVMDQKKFSAAGVYKYMALVKLGEDDESRKAARTYGVQLVSKLYDDEPESLNALAWFIVQPESDLEEDEVDAEFAVMVAEKAAKVTDHEDPNVLDTLARAYFVNGDVQKAISTQEKAIALVEIEQMKEQLEARLAEYRDAASGS